MSTTLTFDLIARDRASDKFDKLGDSAGRSTGKLKAFAKAGALAAGAAAVVAGKALVDMTRAAMEDEKSQAMLATALKNAAGATREQIAATEAWISAQGEALGIADDELRPALSKLVAVTGDVAKAQKMSTLALDVATGTGKSYTSIVDALVRAQNGQVTGLSRLGVATKNADGSTKSLQQVTADLAKTFGGQAAAAADTTQGKFERLRLVLDETKESIGAKLLPVAERLADWFLNKAVPALGKFGSWWGKNVTPHLQKFADDLAPKAREMTDKIKQAFADAQPFLELVGKVFANVLLPVLGKFIKFQWTVLAFQLEHVGQALHYIGEAGKWMWNNALQPAFKFLAKAIGTVLDGFSAMLSALSNVPGFGWAKDAAVAMGKAADKARAVADNIRKIPDKRVTVTVAYRYEGLKSPTRSSGGDSAGGDFMPRMATRGGFTASDRGNLMANYESAFRAADDATAKGGKRLVDKWTRITDSIRTKWDNLKADMESLASAVGSAFNKDVFGGTVEEFWSGLTGNNSTLNSMLAAFDKLKGMGASTGFLSSLFQSGNTDVVSALAAGDAASVQRASGLFDQNAALAGQLGDKVSVNEYGPKAAAQMERIEDALENKLPKKLARELREVLKDIRIEVGGRDAGRGAHLRGAW